MSVDKQIDTMTTINGLKARSFKSLNETFNPNATIAINKHIVVILSIICITMCGKDT